MLKITLAGMDDFLVQVNDLDNLTKFRYKIPFSWLQLQGYSKDDLDIDNDLSIEEGEFKELTVKFLKYYK